MKAKKKMSNNGKQAFAAFAEEINLMELRSIQQISHKLIDQLTLVSGYSQMALERRKAKLGICEELEKIQSAANKAIAMVRLTCMHLREMEQASK
jgi:hypothetical protein